MTAREELRRVAQLLKLYIQLTPKFMRTIKSKLSDIYRKLEQKKISPADAEALASSLFLEVQKYEQYSRRIAHYGGKIASDLITREEQERLFEEKRGVRERLFENLRKIRNKFVSIAGKVATMHVGIGITAFGAGTKELINQFNLAVRNSLQKIRESLKDAIVSNITECYETQSTLPDDLLIKGRPWEPLNRRYVKRKMAAGFHSEIGMMSGEMRSYLERPKSWTVVLKENVICVNFMPRSKELRERFLHFHSGRRSSFFERKKKLIRKLVRYVPERRIRKFTLVEKGQVARPFTFLTASDVLKVAEFIRKIIPEQVDEAISNLVAVVFAGVERYKSVMIGNILSRKLSDAYDALSRSY